MCEFCKIVKKQVPAHIIYESGSVISFLDNDPIQEGHVLIVPKEHVDSLDKLSEKVLFNVMKVASNVVAALKDIYGIEGYSMVQNGGKFCDFGHAHFNVFPRYENDGFGWKYPEGQFESSARVAKRIRKKVMNLQFFDVKDVKDEELKIAVIVAKYKGKLVLCKHKDRITWELPGGHREAGETILEAARRELYEETGAKEFSITPVCAYRVSRYAMLYYAEIENFDELPESEIECVEFFDELPENLTYPSIHPDLYDKAIKL